MTDKTSHNRIKEIFSEALELSESERPQFLEKSCGDDENLRSEVESLLESFKKSENFIEKPAADFKQVFAEDKRIGQIIGNCKIIKEIGKGGMGVVYLASREDEEFKKRVAIRVVKRGLDTEDVLRRFRNERQILAGLHHANIAQLLDGGTSVEGTPYFVMEYVEGLPLLKFCDENRLSTNERLDLFKIICSAVQHAHQNLVIHRDLKPSNILVTHNGEVKLLDFGVAKFLNPEMMGDLSQTQTQFRVMTPEYASPEQIRGEHLTTASDIYSLGVILYELLTGERPFKFEGKSFEQMHQDITQSEPAAPSSVVSRNVSTDSKIPQSAIRDSQTLKGDLDNIVLMALRKEPTRRYKSVEQFAEDIQKYLKGLPVIARPNTFSYLAEKFVKRNFAATIVGSLLVLSLIGGLGFSMWQAQIAARERDRALAEQKKTESVNRFMSRILQAASPEQQGKEAKIMDVLQDVEKNAETEFANQPEQKAQIYLNLGYTYFSIQEYEKAKSLLQKSLQISETSLPADSQIASASLIYLAMNASGQNNSDGAEKYVYRGIELERRISPNGSRTLALGLLTLGEMNLRRSKVAESIEPIQETVTILEAMKGENDSDYAYALGQLGRTQTFQGNPQAEVSLRKSLAIFRSLPKNHQYRIAYPLMYLGFLLVSNSNFDEGMKYLLEADEIANRLNLPHLKYWTKNNLCNAYGLQLGSAKTVESCSEAVKLFAATNAKEGIENVYTYGYLGTSLTTSDRPQEGEVYLRKGLKLAETIQPVNEVLVALFKNASGETLLAQNKIDEARPLIEDTYPIIKSTLGVQNGYTISGIKRLVTLYEKTNNAELANKYRAELPQ